MYIALRWLISLVFVMWLAMCFTDFIVKERRKSGVYSQPLDFSFGNVSKPEQIVAFRRKKQYSLKKDDGMAALHLTMFAAGAIAVFVFNKKSEIVVFAKRKINKIDIIPQLIILKKCAIRYGAAMLRTSLIYWEKIKQLTIWIINTLDRKKHVRNQVVYAAIMGKMKQMGEERKNLGQLLIAAIHENKNIRMRYQLEMMAKNRLVQHIESTHKQIKENRSKYISFQQMFMLTQQENKFLKAKIQKLIKEKEETDKNLMRLVNEIFKSRNNSELKRYCSRFLIKTKESFVAWNAKAEIEEFLNKTSKPCSSKVHEQKPKEYGILENVRYNNSGITEILQKDCLIPVITDAPNFKGLPGEYVWTVKDKHGIIEKLYEYDYESEFNNRDTIRRIRQYSVYYDKDCLLDFSNGLIDHDEGLESRPTPSVTKHRFVTNSEAFQTFLRNNNSVVPFRRGLVY